MAFQVTALDKAGDLVIDEHTFESWNISELQIMFDQMKLDLYSGVVDKVIIERI